MSAGAPALPEDAIQRTLYIHHPVHIYQIPPLSSTKGHTAATWTNNPPLFTARLRVVETTAPTPPAPASRPSAARAPPPNPISAALELTDPNTGELFAVAPYTSSASVEHALDSARFFAIRVVGDGGRKATLGMGFEDRSDAFDFGVCLQEVRKILMGGDMAGGKGKTTEKPGVKARDLRLKDGETITVDIGGLGRQREKREGLNEGKKEDKDEVVPFLPPPPTAKEVRRRSREMANGGDTASQGTASRDTAPQTAEELGFDDGEFGEFQ